MSVRTVALVVFASAWIAPFIGVDSWAWTGAWSEYNAQASPAFAHHDTAYDTENGRLVLAGNNFASEVLVHFFDTNEVWTVGPAPAGANPSGNDVEIAYDSARKTVVLYTGDETWEFAGNVWSNRNPATAPVNCSDGALLCYDSIRAKTLLVGATNIWDAVPDIETWIWDATNWMQVIGPQPASGVLGGMVFDEARGEVVLLTRKTMETWVFDGTIWTQKLPRTSPAPAAGIFDMAYDPVNKLAVVYSGEGGSWPDNSYPTDTWGWDGTDWCLVTTTSTPPENIDYAMSYVPWLGEFLMHGGWGPDNWAGGRSNAWKLSVQPHFPVRTPRILFTASNETANGTFDLYTMDISGNDLMRITSNQFTEWGPAVGPDNNSVAYVDPDLGSSNIFITALDGSSTAAVNNANQALAVQWGDADTLYYLRLVTPGAWSRTFELWKIQINGSGETQVYTNLFSCWNIGTESFHIDQDAQRVYLTSFFTNGTSSIGAGPLSANTVDVILPKAPELLDVYSPALSPDGSRISYCADTNGGAGNHSIYLSNTGSATAVRLSKVYSGNPCWTPDGQHVVYTRAVASTFGGASYVGDIWRVGQNTLGRIPLTHDLSVTGGCAFPTIYEAPAEFGFTDVSKNGAGTKLTWRAAEGFSYTLQSSTDLIDDVWADLFTNQPGVNGSMTVTDAVGTATFRAYRLLGD